MNDEFFSRRDIMRLAALLTAGGAASILNTRFANAQSGAKQDEPLKIGYLPITDATPLLVAHGQGFFEKHGVKAEKPVMFRSWAQLVEAFFAGQVNAVHVLSPIAVWARYNSKAPVKVVAWNHMSGSALSVAENINSIDDLAGKTVAIPFWYSIHNVVLQILLKKAGLTPVSKKSGTIGEREVNLVILAPSDMVPALANGEIAGYIVAEPFNALGELTGIGKILRFTGDVWKDHACCLVLMNESDLMERPQWSQNVVNALVDAQLWTIANRQKTAELLSKDNTNRYTPHSVAALTKVLLENASDDSAYLKSGAIKHPEWREKRIGFQPYPFPSYTVSLIEHLKTTLMHGDNAFLANLDPEFAAKDLVDDRFIKAALLQFGGLPAFGLEQNFERVEVIEA